MKAPGNPTVIVHIDNGVVRYVESDAYVDVIIVDYDLDGVSENEIKVLPDGSKATVRQEPTADVSRKSAIWQELAV
jgi:hypothetical protein